MPHRRNPEIGPGARPCRRLVFALAYHGRLNCGWQRQKNAGSLQAVLEEAFSRVEDGRAVRIDGASRTDRGVHARMQIAAADVRTDIAPRNWAKAINELVPRELVVTWAAWGPSAWQPRHACGAKTYSYRFFFSPVRDPFSDDRAWRVPERVDRHALPALAVTWQTRRDFRAACSTRWDGRGGTERRLELSHYEDRGPMGIFTVRSRGYLTHQVRILAGTLIDVAKGRLTPAAVEAALARGDRTGLGRTAPPHGLTLEHIELPACEWADPWPAPFPDSG